MQQFPASFSTEFRHERSVRRATLVLDAKRRSIRADLKQMIRHLGLLIPDTNAGSFDEQPSILNDAAERLGDETFTALLRQLMEED
ncbi:MAG: hypothetical protein HC838_15005 [Spirulinaceae cyanobacterium RM2_2_10]|nr:hypothetical protein [Spirulinaceae cyanobacterium SM2_1_0]NJO21075.1 hypothetical protein [Spirulinaceae cyanobacterium RM2_2_10]